MNPSLENYLADFGEMYDRLVESGNELILFTVKSGALTRFVLLKQGGGDEGEQADD